MAAALRNLACALAVCAGFAVAAPMARAQTPAVGSVFRDCATCVEMVVVPAGSNEIGSTPEERIIANTPKAFGDREGPRHTVTIAKPFALAKTEVTRALYARFVAQTGRMVDHGCASFDRAHDAWPVMPERTWRSPGFAQTDSDPAICINYLDAAAFAAWYAKLTGKPYRLPSEAEWEYAARAGSKTAYPWGDSPAPLCAHANVRTRGTLEALGAPASWDHTFVCTDKHAYTLPVGSFPPNAFGLDDMIGNAWEWTADCFHERYDGAPTDGTAWVEPRCGHHVVRGGGYQSEPWIARAASRGGPPDAYTEDALGIRLARDLE